MQDNESAVAQFPKEHLDEAVKTLQNVTRVEHRSLSLIRPLVFFDLETTGTILGIDRISGQAFPDD